MKTKKNILLITTGGTIAGEYANKKDNQPTIQVQKIIQTSLKTIELETNINVSIDVFELCEVDSSDILPEHWIAIGDKIFEEYDQFDAFIITHGTNTLAYTATALSFSFENLEKSIVLTGSQIPYGNSGSDAVMNLENSIRVAIGISPSIKGVVVVFGSHIISGVRAKKITDFDYDAFKSYTASSIGRIGREIMINELHLAKHVSYLKKSTSTISENKLIKNNCFDMHVVSLTEFPGMSSSVFKALVEENNTRGFILRSFGAGDVSNNLEKGLQYLKEKKIPIVITSQAPNAISNFQVNKPGLRLYKNKLAIPAWDMSIESQTVKLSWLLGQNYSYSEIMEEMIIDYRGEIHVELTKKKYDDI
ncbi:asparaginase [Dokdonia sp.]|uniref:asparaginase n=1 Tax=Dokdonia sp. TaxID=2024995 RepID=UPI003267EDF9